MIRYLLGKPFINLKEFLLVKVSLPAPGGARNTLNVNDERKIPLRAGKQAGHSIAAHSLQVLRIRFPVLQRLATHIFINPLRQVAARDDGSSPSPLSPSAVFFSARAA